MTKVWITVDESELAVEFDGKVTVDFAEDDSCMLVFETYDDLRKLVSLANLYLCAGMCNIGRS